MDRQLAESAPAVQACEWDVTDEEYAAAGRRYEQDQAAYLACLRPRIARAMEQIEQFFGGKRGERQDG